MDSFGNTNRDVATALTALLVARYSVISEVTPLLDNLIISVPLVDADIEVVAREGWFQLLCRRMTVLLRTHPNSTPTPNDTQDVIVRGMRVLDMLRDQIDDMDLLEVFIAEIPGFEDAYYCVFEADLHYNSDENHEEGDSGQIAAAVMMNEEGRNQRRHLSLLAKHKYAEFVQYIEQTQAGMNLVTAFRRNQSERFENDQCPHCPLTPEEVSSFLL